MHFRTIFQLSFCATLLWLSSAIEVYAVRSSTTRTRRGKRTINADKDAVRILPRRTKPEVDDGAMDDLRQQASANLEPLTSRIIGDFNDPPPALYSVSDRVSQRELEPQIAFRKLDESAWTLYCGVEGPRGEDVVQGSIGDCFFVQALAAVAHTSPELIKNNIQQTKFRSKIENGKGKGRIASLLGRIKGGAKDGKEGLQGGQTHPEEEGDTYGFSIAVYDRGPGGTINRNIVRIDERVTLPAKFDDVRTTSPELNSKLIYRGPDQTPVFASATIPQDCRKDSSPENPQGKLIVWPQLYEKAYTKFVETTGILGSCRIRNLPKLPTSLGFAAFGKKQKHGFNLIADGGYAWRGLFHITGWDDFVELDLLSFPSNTEEMWTTFWANNARRGSGCPVVVNTWIPWRHTQVT
ncbi:hypothetical protein HK102_005646, partial [Quaeritorhiza haematococci]